MRLLWTTPSLQNLFPARLPILLAAPTSAAMLTSTVSGSLSNTACQQCDNAWWQIFTVLYILILSAKSRHRSRCSIMDVLWIVNDVYFNSWSSHGCGASVLAGGPWIWCCVQLCLDRKSLSYNSVDEEGIWSGEYIDLHCYQVWFINSHILGHTLDSKLLFSHKACIWDFLWFQHLLGLSEVLYEGSYLMS